MNEDRFTQPRGFGRLLNFVICTVLTFWLLAAGYMTSSAGR